MTLRLCYLHGWMIFRTNDILCNKPHVFKTIAAFSMEKIIFFLFLFGGSSLSFGQSLNITEARILIDSSATLIKRLDYEGSAKLSKQALELYENLSYIEDTLAAKAYYNLGVANKNLRKFTLAKSFFENALDIRMSVLGKNSLEVADTYEALGALNRELGDFPQALKYISTALGIKLSLQGQEGESVARTYYNLALIYFSTANYDRSLGLIDTTILIRQDITPITSELADSYNLMAGIYYYQGKLTEAEEAYENSLEIYLKTIGESKPKTGFAYFGLGLIYDIKGDGKKCIEYNRKALDIWIPSLGQDHPYVANAFNKIGIVYCNEGNFDKSLENHLKALDIRVSSFGSKHPSVAESFNNLGLLHYRQEDYGEAMRYHRKSIEIKKNIFGSNHHKVANSYNNIGLIHAGLENYPKAIEFFKRSLDIKLPIFGENHHDVLESYNNLSDFYFKSGDTLEGLYYTKKVIDASKLNWKRENIEELKFDLNLLDALYEMGKYGHYDENESTPSQKKIVEITLEILDQFSRQIEDGNSQIEFKKDSYYLYELFLELSKEWEPRDKSKEFSFAEKSKTSVLLSSIRSMNSQAYHDLPDSLQNIEQELDFEEKELNKLVAFEEKNSSGNSDSLLRMYSSEIFDINRKQEALFETFKAEYSNYFNLKYDNTVTTFEEIQKLLDQEQLLIEYFVGHDKIFVFAISSSDYEVIEIKKDFPLEDYVKKIRDAIYLPVLDRSLDKIRKDSFKREYLQVASEIYSRILDPISIDLPKKLIVIPDGILNYLPFDALLTSRPKDSASFNKLPYLINEHTVSYNYSATLFSEVVRKRHVKKSKKLLAVAPFFGDEYNHNLLTARSSIDQLRDTLSPLIWNVKEVEMICKSIGGNSLIRQDATLQNFLSIASEYEILHLSTHGKADDKSGNYSYIAFTETKDSVENEKLYVEDLYGIRLNSEMVVLSACETGLGKLELGEGVIGMTRGFMYAGAKSIVTSLWSVNDKSSQEIMSSFYQQLKLGKTKDEALREAKLNYINMNTVNSSPFYWAAFVPIGDMKTIDFPSSFESWWFVVLLSIGFLGYYLWKLRENKFSID